MPLPAALHQTDRATPLMRIGKKNLGENEIECETRRTFETGELHTA